MATKSLQRDSAFLPAEDPNTDEILTQRQTGPSPGPVGSNQQFQLSGSPRRSDDHGTPTAEISSDDLDVAKDMAERLEQKRQEHERQRVMQRELFEQQMHQLKLQQLREEQAMLASKNGSGNAIGTGAGAGRDTRSDEVSDSSAVANGGSIPSIPSSRRTSNDPTDLWSELDRLSLGGNDKAQRPVDLSKIGRSSTSVKESTSPAESAFSDSAHLSQFTERLIFESDTLGSSTSRLSSLQRNRSLQNDDSIWKGQQGLSMGSSALGGTSYLTRILGMGSGEDAFGALLTPSSSALDLTQLPPASGLRLSADQELSRNSEWPQFGKTVPLKSERALSMSHHSGSILGFGGITSSDNPHKPSLPATTSPFSSAEIPTRFSKVPSLLPFEDMTDSDLRKGLLPSDLAPNDVCLQFQQGYCPRGEMCPYTHTFIMPATTRAPSLHSPGLNASAAGLSTGVGSATFYSRLNSVSGPSSTGLSNNVGFPFNQSQNSTGYQLTSAGSNNLVRAPQQGQGQQQAQSQAQQQQTPQQQQQQTPPLPQQQQAQPPTAPNKGNAKRANADAEANRFAGAVLESFVGQIYSLCKDQHGCRYLQKKLEEQNDKYLAIIFNEVFSHFVELMTDPFGNYLCQKLLEYCDDEQRTVIVETVAPELVNISLNMHGTRAVQKMIEFLSTPQQIAIVVVALNPSVVTLIKDLNGNHVIQKCLNRLTSEDNQFIYNAISTHCIEVATHRHGCCVLQRCIDHASVPQKIQLVREITVNALALVQDPFGNYVVQYVLDLADSRFTDALIRRFIGHVCALSVQKFSSNVMEKCIRVAEPDTRKFLIEEMINKSRLDKLLRDSYANYVVQTSLDFADPIQRTQLVECIRPLLPAIRNTPYGKRIQSKLHRDQLSGVSQQLGHMGMNGINGINSMASMNNMNSLGGGVGPSMNGINGVNMNMNMNMGMGMGMNNMNNMNGMNNMSNMAAMANMSNLSTMGPSTMNMSHPMNGMNHPMNGLPMGPSVSNMGMNMANMNNGGTMTNGNHSMTGMNGMTNMNSVSNVNSVNNMNGNMMGLGFPGMNHYGNVGIIGMNDYNPYNGYM
ncbi:hypothetical protein BGW38_004475 [Lunasporangiospora selenospora]|uniref:ARM repeat-containing protein n=1 Tax=Lunasporangiospora selenospora TaxID=979761 RepID=A0A9P6FQ41_9FUNG|nr:hypothetical protein BGW38_004475 [Lunasporangiospora selenospora]